VKDILLLLNPLYFEIFVTYHSQEQIFAFLAPTIICKRVSKHVWIPLLKRHFYLRQCAKCWFNSDYLTWS